MKPNAKPNRRTWAGNHSLLAATRGVVCALAAAAALLFSGCGNDDDPDPDAEPLLSISPATNAITFGALAKESYTFKVTTNQPVWLPVSDQEWCKVEMNPSENTFTVTALPNDNTTAPTPATITVTAGKAAPVTITATQTAVIYEVYMAGYYRKSSTGQKPCYWKDGVRTDLDNEEGLGSALTVSGGSVYIGGRSGNKTVYWKDGKRVDMTGDNSDVKSIFVENESVYLLGDEVYWKDGVTVGLTNPDVVYEGIAAVNGTVYLAGTFNFPRESKYTAYYSIDGKNDKPLDIPVTNSRSAASCITVSDGSVYIGGYFSTWETDSPCYWKDLAFNQLEVPTGFLHADIWAICVEKGKVYVAGSVWHGNQNKVPGYWADGKFTELEQPDKESNSNITGIAVADGKVYVIANCYDGTAYSCYWVDGKQTVIPMDSDMTDIRVYGIGIVKK